MPVPTSWHPGEIAAQQARGFEDDVWGMWSSYQEGAPSFMVPFLSSLPFLSVTTLDESGLPWTSLLCNDGYSDFLQVVESSDRQGSKLKCTIRAPIGVPIRECLLRLKEEMSSNGIQPYQINGDANAAFQLAAVGVMLHNRRRNKMDGVIVSIDQVPETESDDAFVFHLDVSSTFGNCPKYINVRNLVPVNESTIPSKTTQGDGSKLPSEVLSILSGTDVLFLASKHAGSADAYPADPPRLGNNIRGGPPGFLRTFWDEEAHSTCIVLPDWSGNRLMQSFGNITGDPVAGITIPVWSNKPGRPSDLLHLTCSAQVLANEDASNLIRGVKGAVKLWPRKWTLVHAGLPLLSAPFQIQDTITDVVWSPYNPPVRFLNSEQSSTLLLSKSNKRPIASLIDVQLYSAKIATLTFTIDQPLPYTPGQHIILDGYNLLDTRVQMYNHMANFRGGEKELNDDGTRSWTISYAPVVDGVIKEFEVTLRRKDRGGVTPNLFHQAKMLREELDEGEKPSVARTQLETIGTDGSCFLPVLTSSTPSHNRNLQLAYLLSGIGLTPMLPHLSQLVQSNDSEAKVEVLAVLAVKGDEIGITKQLIQRALRRGQRGKASIHIKAYFLAGTSVEKEEEEKDGERGNEDDLPENITMEIVILRGKRLQETSLSEHTQQGEQGDGTAANSFVLPKEDRMKLEQVEQVVVCAGTAFARTAHQALKLANVPEDKIKMESFAF